MPGLKKAGLANMNLAKVESAGIATPSTRHGWVMKRRAEHVGLCSLYYSVNMIKLDASTTSAWLMLCTLSNLLHSMHLASWDPAHTAL